MAGATGTYFTFQSLDRSVGVDQAEEVFVEPVADGAAGQPDDQANAVPEPVVVEVVNEPTIVALNDGSSALTWFLVLKFIVSSAVTVFGFVSAATWLRRYLDHENQQEEDRLSYAADIERASWVIEAIHEVNHEAKGELPREWVDAVTRNLFAPRQSSVDLDEGAQALRALIGLAGSAKVGPQGLEMEFNKKGTKALGEGGQ